MKLRTISDMNKSYLVVETENNDKTGYQQKMVLKNSLTGILPVEQRQVDGRPQYYYDITDKISLQEYMKRNKVTAKEISYVFTEVIQIIERAGVFLLEQDHFILQPEYMYVYADGKRLLLCFFECYQINVREQLVALAEFFMETIDYNEEKAVTLTYRLYKKLREDTCNFKVVKETISGGKTIECVQEKTIEPAERKMEGGTQLDELTKKEKKEVPLVRFKDETLNYCMIGLNVLIIAILIKTRFLFYQYSTKVSIKHVLISSLCLIIMNMSVIYLNKKRLAVKQEAMLMEYEGVEGTMVISFNAAECLLRAQGRGEDIVVDKFPCILGADKQKADKVIKEPGVSKQHVILEAIRGEVCIRDLKSTNGTFINGELLLDEKAHVLEEGDKVTLANVTYQFMKM